MAVETEVEQDLMATAEEDGDDLSDLEPGIIYRARRGRDITFSNPPIAAAYGDYVDHVLYRVAAAYGISYQALTGNLSKVNFSSGRMGWLDFQRNIERWRWNMVIPQFNQKIAGWFLKAAELTGARVAPDTRFEWTPPRREMIDPAKEVAPLRDAIRAGLTSLPAVHREYGEHTARILAEIESTNNDLDKRGIVLDSDPRKVTKAGLSQPDVTPDEPPPAQ
jgi:capsid protein